MEFNDNQKATIVRVTDEIAETLRETVAEIEATKFPTTRDNYGAYLSMFTVVCNKYENPVHRAFMAAIMAKAAIQAGANPAGVNAAKEIYLGTGA